MALQATHMAFAIDLEPLLDVHNRNAYYMGTLYPDSRYVTKLARERTHDDTCPQDPFKPGLDDFEKGWAVHNTYDRIAGAAQIALVPEWRANDDWAWARLTAIKLVEDVEQAKRPEVLMAYAKLRVPAVPSPNPALRQPRQEPIELLHRHYRLLQHLYDRRVPSLDDYLLHLELSISKDARKLIAKAVKPTVCNEMLMQDALGIYKTTLAQVREGRHLIRPVSH